MSTSGTVNLARIYTSALLEEFAGPQIDQVSVAHLTLTEPASAVSARFYRNNQTNGLDEVPLIVFFHGGGWSVGDVASYDPFMRSLCSFSGASFLSINFRLAPEHIYPAAHDDCFAALKWTFANTSTISANQQKIAVMGDSAGAHLAINAAWRLHNETSYRLNSQYLFYPFLDLRDGHERYQSRMRFGNGEYLIGRESLRQSKEWYLGADRACNDPISSPILSQKLNLLPSTVLVTAGFDPLTDEVRLFHKQLVDANVPVTLHHFKDTIHGFLPFGALQVAKKAQILIANDIRQKMGEIKL